MLANVYYRREANNDDTLEKYAADLPFDRFDKALFRRGTLGFGLTGLTLPPQQPRWSRRRAEHGSSSCSGCPRMPPLGS